MKLALLFLVLFFISIENRAQQLEKKVVIGYVAGWNEVDPDKIPTEKLTHINYALANVVDGLITTGVGQAERDSINFLKLQSLKSKNSEFKILATIGGWTCSKGYSDAALTLESRKKLTASGVDFLIKHNLDGLDFDREYPALQGDYNVVRDIGKQNFVAMLKNFREALDSLDHLHQKHYLSTIASGGFRKHLEVNDLRTAQQYLDLINIMNYDLFRACDDTTGHHTNLYKGNQALMPASKKNRSAQSAVVDHIEFGIPREKIVLEIPFSGKRWKDVGPENNGLYQPGTFGSGLSQDKVYKLQSDPSYREWWDYSVENAFLLSEENHEWVTFESRKSIDHKIYFVKKEKLAGVIFWELSEDPSGSLLEAINLNMKRPIEDFKLKK